MHGYRPPREADLIELLSRQLADIDRRLRILERPTGTQKVMLKSRVEQHKTWLDDHQRQLTANAGAIATEKGRNDAQWDAIDTHTTHLANHQTAINRVNGRANALWDAVNREKSRNDSQWSSISSLRSGLSTTVSRLNSLISEFNAVTRSTSGGITVNLPDQPSDPPPVTDPGGDIWD